MKNSSLANKERYLRQQALQEKKIALDILRAEVMKEMRPIVLALIDKAKEGDHKTAELLFDRTFGKVKDTVDVNVQFSLSSLAQEWEEQQREREQPPSHIPILTTQITTPAT